MKLELRFNNFLVKSRIIHGNKYDYSKVVYVNNSTRVCIICPEHGEYWQRPDNHIQGYICSMCSQSMFKVRMTNRALKTRNWDFEQPKDYKLIPLTKGKFAMVDNEDFDRVRDINWFYTCQGYASNRGYHFMHRYIMNCPEDMVVDHKDGFGLNNRRNNLRICTAQENNTNQRPQKGKSSKYKGVSWDSINRKWRVSIWNLGIKYNLGRFQTEEEAGEAYDNKARELHGEFANLNFKKCQT